MRIGQLTDIHVWDPRSMRRVDWLGKRATGWVNYTRKRAAEYSIDVLCAAIARQVEARPDVVFVSGDLTNLGLRSELEAASEHLQPVRDAGIPIVVVPGNHDFYVPAAMRGDFETVFGDELGEPAGVGTWPRCVRVGSTSLVLVNSALPVPPLMAWGRIGDTQMADIDRVVAAETRAGQTVAIGLHHHPTRAPHKRYDGSRNLRDAAALRAIAERHGVALMMHGHNHYFHVRRMREATTIIGGISSSTTAHPGAPYRMGQTAIWTVADGTVGLEVANVDPDTGTFGDWIEHPLDAVPEESLAEATTG